MKVFVLFLSLLAITSCKLNNDGNDHVEERIREQITEFYTGGSVEGYRPLSYSELDTTALIRKSDGSVSAVTGTLRHTFRSRGHDGTLQEQTDEFEVQLYEDDVVVVPLGYWFRKEGVTP